MGCVGGPLEPDLLRKIERFPDHKVGLEFLGVAWSPFFLVDTVSSDKFPYIVDTYIHISQGAVRNPNARNPHRPVFLLVCMNECEMLQACWLELIFPPRSSGRSSQVLGEKGDVINKRGRRVLL